MQHDTQVMIGKSPNMEGIQCIIRVPAMSDSVITLYSMATYLLCLQSIDDSIFVPSFIDSNPPSHCRIQEVGTNWNCSLSIFTESPPYSLLISAALDCSALHTAHCKYTTPA